MTQDTYRSISNRYSGWDMITVYLIDDLGNIWKEENYEGYGEFGGKCIQELEKEMRERGTCPNLVQFPENWTYVNCGPTQCDYQGFFYPDTKTASAKARKCVAAAKKADKKATILLEAANNANALVEEATELANKAKADFSSITGVAETKVAVALERKFAKKVITTGKKAAKATKISVEAIMLAEKLNKIASEALRLENECKFADEEEYQIAKTAAKTSPNIVDNLASNT